MQDTSVKDHFELRHTALDRTDIAVSRDEGSSWNLLGHAAGNRWWRLPVVRWHDGTLALGTLPAALTFVSGPYVLPEAGYIGYVFKSDQNHPISPDLTFTWDEKTFYENPKLYANAADPNRTPYYVNANVWASTVMAPAGTSDVVVVAVPATAMRASIRQHSIQFGRAPLLTDVGRTRPEPALHGGHLHRAVGPPEANAHVDSRVHSARLVLPHPR